mmetsp:Transcript_13248/g.32200  ORF Transcript_13248/g.32200 Transcript_13248/m.32200 type:complete len:203 (-) Transcript_13248:327-935(-)
MRGLPEQRVDGVLSQRRVFRGVVGGESRVGGKSSGVGAIIVVIVAQKRLVLAVVTAPAYYRLEQAVPCHRCVVLDGSRIVGPMPPLPVRRVRHRRVVTKDAEGRRRRVLRPRGVSRLQGVSRAHCGAVVRVSIIVRDALQQFVPSTDAVQTIIRSIAAAADEISGIEPGNVAQGVASPSHRDVGAVSRVGGESRVVGAIVVV